MRSVMFIFWVFGFVFSSFSSVAMAHNGVNHQLVAPSPSAKKQSIKPKVTPKAQSVKWVFNPKKKTPVRKTIHAPSLPEACKTESTPDAVLSFYLGQTKFPQIGNDPIALHARNKTASECISSSTWSIRNRDGVVQYQVTLPGKASFSKSWEMQLKLTQLPQDPNLSIRVPVPFDAKLARLAVAGDPTALSSVGANVILHSEEVLGNPMYFHRIDGPFEYGQYTEWVNVQEKDAYVYVTTTFDKPPFEAQVTLDALLFELPRLPVFAAGHYTLTLENDYANGESARISHGFDVYLPFENKPSQFVVTEWKSGTDVLHVSWVEPKHLYPIDHYELINEVNGKSVLIQSTNQNKTSFSLSHLKSSPDVDPLLSMKLCVKAVDVQNNKSECSNYAYLSEKASIDEYHVSFETLKKGTYRVSPALKSYPQAFRTLERVMKRFEENGWMQLKEVPYSEPEATINIQTMSDYGLAYMSISRVGNERATSASISMNVSEGGKMHGQSDAYYEEVWAHELLHVLGLRHQPAVLNDNQFQTVMAYKVEGQTWAGSIDLENLAWAIQNNY